MRRPTEEKSRILTAAAAGTAVIKPNPRANDDVEQDLSQLDLPGRIDA